MICIKEEPEDEQDVMATLLLDCQVQQGHLPESEVKLELNIKSENSQHLGSFESLLSKLLEEKTISITCKQSVSAWFQKDCVLIVCVGDFMVSSNGSGKLTKVLCSHRTEYVLI